jgi:hypothetical protein
MDDGRYEIRSSSMESVEKCVREEWTSRIEDFSAEISGDATSGGGFSWMTFFVGAK